MQIVRATSPTTAQYVTSTDLMHIGGSTSRIYVDATNGSNVLSYTGINNGVYAEVVDNNKIQFYLDNSDYGGGIDAPSFTHSSLIVTIQEANNPTKKVTIDLNIGTVNIDTIRKN